GASFVLNADHSLAIQMPSWQDAITLARFVRNGNGGWSCATGEIVRPPEHLEAVYRALVMGLGDYVSKNRFPGVLLGLSGGIDSAITAAIAVDALGPDKVRAVMMPSPYTSQ